MSTVGVSVANVEFDAAQALLDLQSNFRERKPENYEENPKESVETAKFFLSCFIASNVKKPNTTPVPASKVPPAGTFYPVKSDVGTSTQTTKRKTPDYELPRDYSVGGPHHNSKHYTEDSESKKAKTFKRKSIKQFTVTAGPVPDVLANKKADHTNKPKATATEMRKKTRDVATQTEDRPAIEIMENTIATLCEKIKVLQAEIEALTEQNEKIAQQISESEQDFDGDDDESYRADSNEMDDSNADDSDLDDTDYITPKKENKPKLKVEQHNGHNKATKVLKNRNLNTNDDVVSIGDGNAVIPSRIFRHINWNSYTSATRKLLTAVFSRRVLATHSLTGKPSPAFPNKPAKKKLDQSIVNDIVQTVVERCCVPENVVRTSITTKCADESKMFRTRQQNKKKRKLKFNRENIPPESDSDDSDER
ncbi:unnamed protein product [Chrysodeixis includens]|uniref:BEN domain-containing protein n=1 Tax=Chrysodeixis includens TaxID=689277 RepID=A0A9N8KY93_CHRIL|nr:unnamed protein product [Chrysodeixis includens]